MAQDHDGATGGDAAGSTVEKYGANPPSAGTAVVVADRIPNPGFEPYRPRVTDLDEAKERQQERRVAGFFILSIVGTVAAIVAYIIFPIVPGDLNSVRFNNLFLGIGITLALLSVGIGAIHWSKSLMDGHDMVEQRHGTRGSDETRAKAVEVFTLGNKERVDLSKFDVVHMRQDPPFDMGYITATHMLEAIHPKTLVVNDPKEVRNAPEKLFVLNYPQFTPETLITRDPVELAAFRRQHGDIILKPLYGNGGAGVFRLGESDQNFSSLLELFTQTFREPFIAQKYLPDVRKGDKRIILVDGKAAGAINRVPAVNENRSNMHVGGKAEPTVMTKREHEICEALGPDLKEKGLTAAAKKARLGMAAFARNVQMLPIQMQKLTTLAAVPAQTAATLQSMPATVIQGAYATCPPT